MLYGGECCIAGGHEGEESAVIGVVLWGGAAVAYNKERSGDIIAYGTSSIVESVAGVVLAADVGVGVVAVADGASVVADDGADIANALDGAAEVDAVLDGAVVVNTCYAAVVRSVYDGISDGNGGTTSTAGDGTLTLLRTWQFSTVPLLFRSTMAPTLS